VADPEADHNPSYKKYHRGGRVGCWPLEQAALKEVPAKLRKQLEDSTNSFNSATILIADRRGREEIVRDLNGLPSSLRSRLASALIGRPETAEAPPKPELKALPVIHFLRRNWLEILLPGAVGLIIWAAFNFR
jgi:hypothetical protein